MEPPNDYIEALITLVKELSDYKKHINVYKDIYDGIHERGIINFFKKIFQKSDYTIDKSAEVSRELDSKARILQRYIIETFVKFKINTLGHHTLKELLSSLYIGESRSFGYDSGNGIKEFKYKPTLWIHWPEVRGEHMAIIDSLINDIMWEAKLEKEKKIESSNADDDRQNSLPQWATASEIAVYLGLDKTDKPLRTALSRVYGKSHAKKNLRENITNPRKGEDKYRWNTPAEDISDVIIRFQKKTE